MHIIDAEDMYDYAKREEVTKYLLWSVHPSITYTRDYLRYIEGRYALGDFYDWAIIECESRRMIGTCGFTRINTEYNSGEIGYVLNPDFWGKGYACEAARCVMDFGFEALGLHRIEARFMKGNEASQRVMEKLGMKFEGYHVDEIYVKGEYKTVGVCAKTK
jgi:ribosomal-protein-alanine N-acetyltransferase